MKIKQIIQAIIFSFSIVYALNLNDLRQIQGVNPTPYELNSYILKKCRENDIPPIVLKAILLKEGQVKHKWQQYSPDGYYNHESIVYGTDRASYGLGLFQITYKVDDNKNFMNYYDFNQIKKVVSDWKYNIDRAVITLLSKWRSSVGSTFTGIDANRLIIENWYYPIAWYNGSGDYAKLYVDNVYKYMRDRNSLIIAIGNSKNSDKIYSYYKIIPEISDPYIISTFRGDSIRGTNPQPYTLQQIINHGGEIHIWDKINNTYKVYEKNNDDVENNRNITRAKALKLILDKFKISTKNAGFNNSRFGQNIKIPSDVTSNTSNYDAIVVGYNRGIITGSNGKFLPINKISLEEFITMIVRTIPVPLDNPKYKNYSYATNSNFYKYLKAAYNANILENKSYKFEDSIDESTANSLLNKAFEYFRGTKSGISIYLKWNQKYVDLDMYAYSPADSSNIKIEKDDNNYITNMSALSSNILYYGRHSTDWGANLDYDSWGGNGSQPWAGFGEERATVDSLMVKRPGTYSFIICYYDWGNSLNPSNASYEMIGYKGSKNITNGGSIQGSIQKGKCKVGGTLTTR